jgi:mRNA interferase RelE/StbE
VPLTRPASFADGEFSLDGALAISEYSDMKTLFLKSAIKDMQKLPSNQRERVAAKVRQLAEDPAALANNIKALTGRPESRLRIGDLRVLFVIEDGILTVKAVKPRGEAYE